MTLDEAIANLLCAQAYRELEQGASLKGLLKPFKGKGELLEFAVTLRRLQAQLAHLMAATVVVASQPPFSLLDLRLVTQRSAPETLLLRWRSRDFSRMGVPVWVQAMQQPQLSRSVREALYQLEVNRTLLNLQMSSLHSLSRQVIHGAVRLVEADLILNPDSPSTQEHHP